MVIQSAYEIQTTPPTSTQCWFYSFGFLHFFPARSKGKLAEKEVVLTLFIVEVVIQMKRRDKLPPTSYCTVLTTEPDWRRSRMIASYLVTFLTSKHCLLSLKTTWKASYRAQCSTTQPSTREHQPATVDNTFHVLQKKQSHWAQLSFWTPRNTQDGSTQCNEQEGLLLCESRDMCAGKRPNDCTLAGNILQRLLLECVGLFSHTLSSWLVFKMPSCQL